MTQFPADWQVFPAAEYQGFHRVDTEDPGRSILVLIPLDPAHRSRGDFKLLIFGGGALQLRLPLPALIPELPEEFQQLYLDIESQPADTIGQQNVTVGDWRDIEEIISSREGTLTDEIGRPAASAGLLKFLQTPRPEKSSKGASVRWAVAADEDGDLRLELQALPAQARYLQKTHLKGDNVVSVLMGEFPLHVAMFEGQAIAGPVPLLFSPYPAAALGYMSRNPETIREDIMRINSRFLRMEHLTLEEASQYLKKRLRAAKGVAAYQHPGAPPAKRIRTTALDGSETGTYFLEIENICHLSRNVLVIICLAVE